MVDFHPIIGSVLPRILTQLNRDPNTLHYGSFDRNWWHYKIRDFSSIILQQGGYFLEMAADLPEFKGNRAQFRSFADAAVDFWAGRAVRRGAFEEYYPWEDGYPPLAFSTLAIAKIIHRKGTGTTRHSDALRKAAIKLTQRFEPQAANQQIAGLAALAVLKKLDPGLVNNPKFEHLTVKTLALQSEEGWFNEYDGPDLGYLSVSLDCLWDLYDYTGDPRFYDSAERAFSFLSRLVIHRRGSIGMHNARNTDYIVPYGICRFLQSENQELVNSARQVAAVLYSGMDSPLHFFHATDDRYWSHYIGHSVVRAQLVLDKIKPEHETKLPVIEPSVMKQSGMVVSSSAEHRIIISCLKGGIVTLTNQDDYFNDFGWIVFDHGKQFVTHWWTPSTVFSGSPDDIRISGHPVPFRENTSTPFKHFVLRAVSYFTGHKIISLLKNLLIFRKSDRRYAFTRHIELKKDKLVITDQISGLKGSELIVKAPRFSKRHVASADSFHPEDMEMVKGYTVETESHINGSVFIANTLVKLH